MTAVRIASWALAAAALLLTAEAARSHPPAPRAPADLLVRPSHLPAPFGGPAPRAILAEPTDTDPTDSLAPAPEGAPARSGELAPRRVCTDLTPPPTALGPSLYLKLRTLLV